MTGNWGGRSKDESLHCLFERVRSIGTLSLSDIQLTEDDALTLAILVPRAVKALNLHSVRMEPEARARYR